MIYQSKPSMMCSLFSRIRFDLTLTTIHPIDLADSIAKLRLIFLLKIFKGFLVLIALASIVPFYALLMSLQRIIPSPTASKRSFESGLIGINSAQSLSSCK